MWVSPKSLIIFSLSLICIQKSCQQPISPIKSTPVMSTELIQPDYLKAGDTVAIVAPSGILNDKEAEIERAKALLEGWGLKVKIGNNIFNKAGHFAGSDSERKSDLQQAINDPNISAVWSARGGYGTVRVIDQIDYSALKTNPKWIIGYSDITALHNDLNNQGIESIHAMMCSSLPEDLTEIDSTIHSFKKAIFGEPLSYVIPGSEYNRSGDATGALVGGNLTLLHTMLGSRSTINTNGKIVFFEEIGEYAYHIDRMLMSLKRAGFFNGCKGVIVGDISKVRENTTPWGKPIEQLVLDALVDYDFPIAFGFPAGHEKDNRALILGRRISLKVDTLKTKVVFSE
ncbi:MAG: LD-carboxypeptidase [Flavobacteriaceae bacterium]|nr:LD-carboxypeptidase [Bacteroidia bacterium]MBT8288853.1 LD-carboxypeptidase [Bacteroidia bacterium]NNF74376.1 LD-carboxypeptidase [Flavobacteriaceae bacterium]